MITEPPFWLGAVQRSDTCAAPAVALRPVGALGTPTAARTTSLEGLLPAEFTALTRNEYVTPLVRPVTVADVAVDTPSLNVDHVEPLLDENSIV